MMNAMRNTIFFSGRTPSAIVFSSTDYWLSRNIALVKLTSSYSDVTHCLSVRKDRSTTTDVRDSFVRCNECVCESHNRSFSCSSLSLWERLVQVSISCCHCEKIELICSFNLFIFFCFHFSITIIQYKSKSIWYYAEKIPIYSFNS